MKAFLLIFLAFFIEVEGQTIGVNNWVLNNNGKYTDLSNTGSVIFNDGQKFYFQGLTEKIDTDWLVSTMWMKDFKEHTPNVFEFQYTVDKIKGDEGEVWMACALQDSTNQWGFTWQRANGLFSLKMTGLWDTFKNIARVYIWLEVGTSDSCFAGTEITAKKMYGISNSDTTTYDNFGIVTEVEKQELTPAGFALYQNYPNPFNPTTTIKFSLPAGENIVLKVYDILGNEVFTLINNKYMSAGDYNVSFDGSRLPSGTYIYKLTAGEYIETKKMLLIK
ncbi:MAG: T9SS type A sorting domain-containing protein [Bacteroidetes bacterium]|nr:T9SS type A sorting domain-containing protein [Bacteroidota bacterium]